MTTQTHSFTNVSNAHLTHHRQKRSSATDRNAKKSSNYQKNVPIALSVPVRKQLYKNISNTSILRPLGSIANSVLIKVWTRIP